MFYMIKKTKEKLLKTVSNFLHLPQSKKNKKKVEGGIICYINNFNSEKKRPLKKILISRF